MNRRRFLAALAAGIVVTAEGLWVPGAKLISTPKLRPDDDLLSGLHRIARADALIRADVEGRLRSGMHELFNAQALRDIRIIAPRPVSAAELRRYGEVEIVPLLD